MTTFKLTEKYHKLAIRIEEDRKRSEKFEETYRRLNLLFGCRSKETDDNSQTATSKGDVK